MKEQMNQGVPADVLEGARAYCAAQFAVMREYGSAPKMTRAEKEALAQSVARIVMKARGRKAKI